MTHEWIFFNIADALVFIYTRRQIVCDTLLSLYRSAEKF